MKTLLKGGQVVSESCIKSADVLIKDGQIVKVEANIKDQADRVVDVKNKLLFPGFIDAHTHFNLYVADTVTADDYETGTKAAISGGTTTIIDYATQYKGESLHEAVENWHKKADGKASCDYAFHLAISDLNDAVKNEISEIVAEGISSFKLYMTYDGMYLNDREIYEISKQFAELSVFAGVHCENKHLIEALVKEQKANGHFDTAAHPLSRPDTVEAEAIGRLMKISKLAGSRVMVVHLTSQKGLDEVLKGRAMGVSVLTETCPQYLLLDDSVYSLPDFEGARYVISPPIRKKADSIALWQALKSGDIDTIATDHCSFNLSQKRAGIDDFTKIPNGMPGVESRAALLIDKAVNEHDMSYSDMCRLLSTRAAKIYGLYPKKGVIAAGADADIVVWDPNKKWTMSIENQVSAADYCPFEGMSINGMAEKVFLHGEIVAENGHVVSEYKGRYLRRGLPCHA